jgi:hypothetical protein
VLPRSKAALWAQLLQQAANLQGECTNVTYRMQNASVISFLFYKLSFSIDTHLNYVLSCDTAARRQARQQRHRLAKQKTALLSSRLQLLLPQPKQQTARSLFLLKSLL